jgi:hypothetical protein
MTKTTDELVADLESRRATLYWLHDESCRDPLTDGYIGITGATTAVRFWQHRRFSRFPTSNYSLSEMLTASRADCLRAEFWLRPTRRIGWNTNGGGGRLRQLLLDNATEKTR